MDHRITGSPSSAPESQSTASPLVAAELTTKETRATYPQPTSDDIRACPAYVARTVDERELPVHCVMFLLDECLPRRLTYLLCAAGHDTAHAYDAGLRAQPDEAIPPIHHSLTATTSATTDPQRSQRRASTSTRSAIFGRRVCCTNR